MRINYQECFYSNGHDCCTHQHYCFFNENTWELMKQIHRLEIDLINTTKSLNQLDLGDYYCNEDYNKLSLKKEIISNDLKRLKEFENKVKNKEIKGYGYNGLLES